MGVEARMFLFFAEVLGYIADIALMPYLWFMGLSDSKRKRLQSWRIGDVIVVVGHKDLDLETVWKRQIWYFAGSLQVDRTEEEEIQWYRDYTVENCN
jgi:hypothetical protein